MLPNAFGNGIWEGEQAAPAVNPNDLNLLDDPNFFLDIDEKTLQVRNAMPTFVSLVNQ